MDFKIVISFLSNSLTIFIHYTRVTVPLISGTQEGTASPESIVMILVNYHSQISYVAVPLTHHWIHDFNLQSFYMNRCRERSSEAYGCRTG